MEGGIMRYVDRLRQMMYRRLSYRRYWKIGEGGSFIKF